MKLLNLSCRCSKAKTCTTRTSTSERATIRKLGRRSPTKSRRASSTKSNRCWKSWLRTRLTTWKRPWTSCLSIELATIFSAFQSRTLRMNSTSFSPVASKTQKSHRIESLGSSMRKTLTRILPFHQSSRFRWRLKRLSTSSWAWWQNLKIIKSHTTGKCSTIWRFQQSIAKRTLCRANSALYRGGSTPVLKWASSSVKSPSPLLRSSPWLMAAKSCIIKPSSSSHKATKYSSFARSRTSSSSSALSKRT